VSESASTPKTEEADEAKNPLPEIIPPEAVEALRKVGIDSPEKAAAVMAITASIPHSPFPAPDVLRAYDDYRPGMGAEVVEHIREQTRHRQALERERVDGSEKRQNRAQRNAFIIGTLSLFVSAGAAYYSTFVAAIIVIVGIGGPATATIAARLLDRLTRS
jgi:uncharacterized membrane protein